MFNIKEVTTIKERLDLKNSLVQYINERVLKYTKLDRHDKAILILLQENKDLEEDLDAEKSTNANLSRRILKTIEYMEHYIKVEDAPINERIKIEFEEILKILKGEE